LRGQTLSFTEIARLVGEKWKSLPPEEKEHFELQAALDKDKYNIRLVEYKKTENYREHQTYLADFKLKNSKDHGREIQDFASALSCYIGLLTVV
jgi:HMG (high mobility group) box